MLEPNFYLTYTASTTVELIQANMVASTENVKRGNEVVIQDKANYRVYMYSPHYLGFQRRTGLSREK